MESRENSPMMTCNLCGETHFLLVYTGNMEAADLSHFSQYFCHGSIYRCNACGLHMQKPEHEIDELIGMIKRDTYSDEKMNGIVLVDKRQQFEAAIRFMENWIALAGKSYLDVGANTGLFLELVQTYSCNIRGIEPSTEAAGIAQSRLGDVVYNGTIEEANLPANSFDIITVWDVIEHLVDPKSDLQHLVKSLIPGGLIFISTHDIDAWFAKITGRHYPLLMYQHFYHFSLETMRQMLESIGLEVLGHKYYSKSWSLAFLHQLILELYPQYKIARMLSGMLKPILSNKWVGRIRLIIPTQNNFIIVARRPLPENT